LLKKNKIDQILGWGKVQPGKKIEVEDSEGKKTVYAADHIIIATGGRARELPAVKIDNEKIVGYRKAMVLEKKPKKMVVIGSGAIGVEFAYVYSSIGTEVTIVEFMDRIVPVKTRKFPKLWKKSTRKVASRS
jgi:dihydrolipoamide dehydrogenase